MRTKLWQSLTGLRSALEFCRLYPGLDRTAIAAVLCLEQMVERVRALLGQELRAVEDAAAAREDIKEIGSRLKGLLLELVRLARVAAMKERLPEVRITVTVRFLSGRRLVEECRIAIACGLEHRVVLARYGMRADLLRALHDHRDGYLAALDRHHGARAASRMVGAELMRLAVAAPAVMRRVDDAMRARFKADPERLAEWQAALKGLGEMKRAG